MADITKCKGIDCPIRDKCYRFTAPDGRWQSYSNFAKYLNETKTECPYFYLHEVKDVKRSKKDK